MTWQDLSLAPTDGTLVDLWCEGYRVSDSFFDAKLRSWTVLSFGIPRIVQDATHWMPRPAGPNGEPCAVESVSEDAFHDASYRNRGRWTMVYANARKTGMAWYVRLVPDFMDLEAAGFPHGLSVGSITFESEEEAKRFAQRIEAFGEHLLSDLSTHLGELITRAGVFNTTETIESWRNDSNLLKNLFNEIASMSVTNTTVKRLALEGKEIAEVLGDDFQSPLPTSAATLE